MKFSTLIVLGVLLHQSAWGQVANTKLLGNDLGYESFIFQDNLIEEVRYKSRSFLPLHIGYYRFSSKSIFYVNVSYHKRTARSNSSEIKIDSYDMEVSYLRKVLQGNRLSLYLGPGNHTYFTLSDFRGLENTYDMGILNLKLNSLLEARFPSYQVLVEVAYGVVKYGSRSGYDWILDIDKSFDQKWTSLKRYDEATTHLRVNIPIKRLVLSPSWKVLVYRNRENETMTILRNQFLVGAYIKL